MMNDRNGCKAEMKARRVLAAAMLLTILGPLSACGQNDPEPKGDTMYCGVLSEELVQELAGPDARIKVIDDKEGATRRNCLLKDESRSAVIISANVAPRHEDDEGMRKLVDESIAYGGGDEVPVPSLSKVGYARASIDERFEVNLAWATPESYIRITFNPPHDRRGSAGEDIARLAEELFGNLPSTEGSSSPGPSETVSSMNIKQTPSDFYSRLSDRMGWPRGPGLDLTPGNMYRVGTVSLLTSEGLRR